MGHLALSFVYMVAVWGVCGWRPGRARRGAGVRQLLGFGGNLTGFVVINYFARNLDNMLIGRFWGGFQLGLYAKAYQLLLLPLDQISYPLTNVAVPTLSRLNGEPERYRRAYLRILEKVTLVTMPGIALMVATADWVVLVVLGPQWVEAGRIFALLGVAALLQPVTNTTGWLFITQGRTREMFRWAPIGAGLVVAAIVAGLPWGAAGVATAYSVVWVLLMTPLLFWYVGRRGHVRTRDIYAALAPALFASVGGFAAVMAYRRWAAPSVPFEGLVISCLIMAAVTLALLALLPAGRRALRDAWGTAALLSGRARG
jgi:O-antigen/teichoic acid export membrane protein